MLIGIIIVTYNSDIARLELILTSLEGQGLKYFISDNSTDFEKKSAIQNICNKLNASFIDMHGNMGIAKAQNDAILMALREGCDDVLLLDDDSLPSPDMLNKLLDARKLLFNKMGTMPVVCSNAIAENGQSLSHFQKPVIDGIFTYRDMISSGTLINKSILDLVGLHEEELFIDCVDYEWGWRAANLGVNIVIVQNAVLNHRLGNGRVKAINAGYGAPIRHYYQYRNILYMMCRNYVPLSWRVSQFFKLLIKPVVIIVFFDKKITRLKYVFQGVSAFIRKQYGNIGS
ncbi:glycosyltransferase [Enterobacter quasiroggenkampii]|uniref:glycosyltransferase n=1 Tax=Enterobacter quasiroggenkampii TaxID=2497436 RepID=UPI0021D1546C|nr:glycosyltransferase [Enterobacter quasiroggenkampii]MCU6345521.1 glycosyltransferase [Enterobacter quasiroggenkampii]